MLLHMLIPLQEFQNPPLRQSARGTPNLFRNPLNQIHRDIFSYLMVVA